MKKLISPAEILKRATRRAEMGKRERQFADIWRVYAPPGLVLSTQVWFSATRKFALDFAHEPTRTGIEIQGSTYSKVRKGHSTGAGIARDNEKSNHAIECGWICLKYDSTLLDKEPKEVVDQIVRVIMFRKG